MNMATVIPFVVFLICFGIGSWAEETYENVKLIRKILSEGEGDPPCKSCKRKDSLEETEEALDLIRDVTLLVKKYVTRRCPGDCVPQCRDDESNNDSSPDLCENQITGDNNGDYIVSRCQLNEVEENGDELVMASPPGSRWSADSFCQAAAQTRVSPENNYTLSVNLYQNGNGAAGHIGVMFNGVDPDNYDFVYFRTHTYPGCYQTGSLVNSTVDFSRTKSGVCGNGQPKPRTWFEIKVVVTTGNAAVYRDGSFVVNITPKYPLGGLVGVVVANGYRDKVHFRNLAVIAC